MNDEGTCELNQAPKKNKSEEMPSFFKLTFVMKRGGCLRIYLICPSQQHL